MGTYVVGDIHGCYSKWISLKEKIESQDEDARFILVGDIVDRGSEMTKMLLWAFKNITKDGKYRMVLGNHEDLKINWWKHQCNCDYDLEEDYNFDKWCLETKLTKHYIDEIIDWFKKLPLVIQEKVNTNGVLTNYIIVHSSIMSEVINENGEFDKSLVKSDDVKDRLFCMRMCGERINNFKEYVIWYRNYRGYDWSHNTVVVHGHSPTALKDLLFCGSVAGRIDYRSHDINVDCGAVYNEDLPLAAIRLEDLQEFYSNDFDVEDNKLEGLLNRKKCLLDSSKYDNNTDFDELFKNLF